MCLAKLMLFVLVCGSSALPVVTLPWFGHTSLNGLLGCLGYISDLAEEKTIYQVLKDDTQYSRLVKAIDLSESVVELLSDPSTSITFFAVPNSKFPRHRKFRHDDHRHDEALIPLLADNPAGISHDLGDLVQWMEELEEEPDSRDKTHKEALASVTHKVIAYHILPKAYETADLIQNSTYATNLTLDDGSMDWEPLRLSILSTSVPPRIRINVFVEVTKRDIKAKNGVIHQIGQPLIPPASIFQETFSVPEVFSFFTSAIQRVGLTDALDRWKYSRGDGKEVGFLGATAATTFAPTSSAFKRLPKKLKSYLFSPFGRKALKKLLEYHIVPDSVLHTDYFLNSTYGIAELSRCLDDVLETQFLAPMPALPDGDIKNLVLPRNTAPLPELVYEYNVTLPTLLQDHHLQVYVARYKFGLPIPGFPQYFTKFKVNGHYVVPYDIPARNGALHVLSTVLDPRKGHDHRAGDGETEDDKAAWEDWEEWLPQWAVEN